MLPPRSGRVLSYRNPLSVLYLVLSGSVRLGSGCDVSLARTLWQGSCETIYLIITAWVFDLVNEAALLSSGFLVLYHQKLGPRGDASSCTRNVTGFGSQYRDVAASTPGPPFLPFVRQTERPTATLFQYTVGRIFGPEWVKLKDHSSYRFGSENFMRTD